MGRNPYDLEVLVRDFSKDLYKAESDHSLRHFEILFPQLSDLEKDMLNCQVTEVEIYNAVKQMGPYKSPGPDGFSPIFFQKNWDIVGGSVIKFVKEAFRTRQFPKHMNSSFITLVPKVDRPKKVSQFCPISLANVVLKIISKVIANRLKLVIGKLVCENQCSFIPGRQACDNIIVAQEVLHTMRKKTGCVGEMIIKLDLEKAYDRINWQFLHSVLQAVGYNGAMLEMIMYLVTTSQMCIL